MAPRTVTPEAALLSGRTGALWGRGGRTRVWLTWERGGTSQFIGQLKLGGVPLHGGSDQQLEGPPQLGLHTVRLRCHGLLVHVNDVLVDVILLRGGGLCAGVGCGRARPAGSPLQDPGVGNGLEFSFAG